MHGNDLDIAARVAARYVAQVRAGRLGREVQRRPGGLVTVGDEEDGADAAGSVQFSRPLYRPRGRPHPLQV